MISDGSCRQKRLDGQQPVQKLVVGVEAETKFPTSFGSRQKHALARSPRQRLHCRAVASLVEQLSWSRGVQHGRGKLDSECAAGGCSHRQTTAASNARRDLMVRAGDLSAMGRRLPRRVLLPRLAGQTHYIQREDRIFGEKTAM